MKREEQERKEKIAKDKREAEEKRINDLVLIVTFIHRLYFNVRSKFLIDIF